MKHLIKMIDLTSEYSGRLASLLCLAIVGSLTYETIARYTFNAPTSWSYDMTSMLFGAIAVLGLAYKPYSHVIEESQSVSLVEALIQAGIRVVAYDPLAGETVNIELGGKVVILDSLEECLDQADIVLVTTPDPEFKAIQVDDFKGKNVIVVDFWRILDKRFSDQSNIRYIPFGRSSHESENIERLAKLWYIENL